MYICMCDLKNRRNPCLKLKIAAFVIDDMEMSGPVFYNLAKL